MGNLLANKSLKIQLTEKNKGRGVGLVSDLPELQGAGADEERADVAILMCTYNGSSFLREQLDSFGRQSYRDWTLYVSDDSSADSTRDILDEYQRRWGSGKLFVFDGPCQGFAKNFMSLLKRPEVQARYYAFSDQDDVWFDDKLERSVVRLASMPEQKPALYCSRTRLTDAEGSPIGFSPLFARPPSFQNALVQSLAGANTMLINQAAREFLLSVPEDSTVVAHDWLAYLLVTACGGCTFYDSGATLDYRQHGGNIIGANASYKDRLFRVRNMLSGRFVEWNDANLEILRAFYPLLTQEARATLEHFEAGRTLGFKGRLCEFYRAGIYRQTHAANISLIVAACLGKI
ncbi:glycosyltransferase family 2 protein [Pseudomonas sp. NPDC087817]|uniref:glycosyltransferase family 2 protein n=1 Tax=Pseudomonas sp. NPDC087817 TaxID=3364451 RepID=UPI0037F51BDF